MSMDLAIPKDTVAILAYGSLLCDSPQIKPHVRGTICEQLPFGMEYTHSSDIRGNAPVLVRRQKAEPVLGRLIVLDKEASAIEEVRQWLWEIEAQPESSIIKVITINGRPIVFADLEPNIPEEYLSPDILAELAIASVSIAKDGNGIGYLSDNLSAGVTTPFSAAYREAVLKKTKARNLGEAERNFRALSVWEILKCEEEFVRSEREPRSSRTPDFSYLRKLNDFVASRTEAELQEKTKGRATPELTERLKTDENALATHVVTRLHANKSAALCFSGGGIRSATFCLGFLETLGQRFVTDARNGCLPLLASFDYLSTVSGGGYIGSWLTSWIHRTSLGEVTSSLRHGSGTKLDPEAATVGFLRRYTNYLNPKLGITSADTWSLVATFIRNILLNWLVLLPLIMSVLLLPQLMTNGVEWLAAKQLTSFPFLIAANLFGMIAFAFLALSLPASEMYNPPQSSFLSGFLLPGCLGAATFSIYVLLQQCVAEHWKDASIAAIFSLGSMFVIVFIWAWIKRRRTDLKWVLQAFMVLLFSLLLGSLIMLAGLHFAPNSWSTRDSELFVLFSVPSALLTAFCLIAILVGLSSKITEEEDREWFARAGGWLLIVACGWVLLTVIGVFGSGLMTLITTSVGSTISGAILSILGRSPKTGASAKAGVSLSSLPKSARIQELAVAALLPVFVLLLLIALSALNRAILNSVSGYVGTVQRTLLLLCCELLLSGAAALWVNVNKFSLHDMYKLRLIRAYLGASRPNREPNLFTGFDPKDNANLRDLRQRPLHIVNMALNLVAGKRLAWQQRKAASFTASPFHAGSCWWGYRPVYRYSDKNNGMTVGGAITISGAAASPNMGYHSSPLLTIVMTLFNARLGAWLGNTGIGGNRTWQKNGPTFGWRSYIDELFGLTNESNKWVYLSDGGHFENLGLYEMVLRRCRTIVAVDASCDKDFVFEDLANAVRKIRIDLGVPIDFTKGIKIGEAHKPSYHWAVATIRYSQIDHTDPGSDGHLLYIKPSLTGDEPADVVQYSRSKPDFPHETTADQWFTESQFESYRALGYHVGSELIDNGNLDLEALVKRAGDRVSGGNLKSLLRSILE
jgi:hypothetical protein